MTDTIKTLIDARQDKLIKYVKKHQTELSCKVAYSDLCGYLYALHDVGFVSKEEVDKITDSFLDESLGYVRDYT